MKKNGVCLVWIETKDDYNEGVAHFSTLNKELHSPTAAAWEETT